MLQTNSTQYQVRDNCTNEEWQARLDLACAYRLFYQLGWHALIFNHITLRVPGPDRHFLINPFGLMYREVTASNLIKVDLDGNLIEPSPWPLFEPGFVVHSGIHRHSDDVHCVMHTHTDAGVAVSCLAEGLLPLDSTSLRFVQRVAYHDFEGLTVDRAESDRMAEALGDKQVMFLRNHGVIACGTSVAHAFENLYLLEMACCAQVTAQASGARLLLQSNEMMEKVTRQKETHPAEDNSGVLWEAMRRWMRDIDPSFES